MSTTKRGTLPSREAIAAYWSTVPVDWNDGTRHPMEHNVYGCWACAWPVEDCGPLERCHLVPRSKGGPDTVSNLVLLCARCHRRAPNTVDAGYMLDWMYAYADREAERAFAFARETLDLVTERMGPLTDERATELTARMRAPGFTARLNELLNAATTNHYADGVNASTMAWAVEQALSEAA